MKTVEDLMKVEPDNSPEAKRERLEGIQDAHWALGDPEVHVKYFNQYVAVYQKQIVAHGEDRNKVLDEAEKVTGLPRNRIVVVPIVFWD